MAQSTWYQMQEAIKSKELKSNMPRSNKVKSQKYYSCQADQWVQALRMSTLCVQIYEVIWGKQDQGWLTSGRRCNPTARIDTQLPCCHHSRLASHTPGSCAREETAVAQADTQCHTPPGSGRGFWGLAPAKGDRCQAWLT